MTAPQLLAYISAAIFLQLAAGIGAGIWHRRANAAVTRPGGGAQGQVTSSAAWQGWRDFRVVSREFEDEGQGQCSFHLEPVDGAALPPFLPGQYLTFSLAAVASEAGAAGAERAVTRCYSLSDRPESSHYRITVKRVPPPPDRPDLPPGASSTHLHDRVHAGDVLRVKAPAGRFFIDADSDLPMVLVAGGIGVTPMMSMLRWCLAEQPRRTVHLYYGVRCGSEQSFRQTLESLAAAHPNFHLNMVYSEPGPNDMHGDGRQAGRIDVDLLRRTLPHGRHQFYVCGPPAMMASLVPALGEWGVDAGDIHFESFGPASVPPAGTGMQVNTPTGNDVTVSLDVQFLRAGRTLAWRGQDDNLLDFAERQGIALESGCRSGSCGSCEVRLVSGSVRYPHPPDYEVATGCCLVCVGKPQSALVLDA
jgi:ferredoxin-NADP reductase